MKQLLFEYCADSDEYEYNPNQKHNGDTPNARKKQRKDKESGNQLHTIHITNVNDMNREKSDDISDGNEVGGDKDDLGYLFPDEK